MALVTESHCLDKHKFIDYCINLNQFLKRLFYQDCRIYFNFDIYF